MAYRPKPAGPKSIRSLYHWIWKGMSDIGDVIDGLPPFLTDEQNEWVEANAGEVGQATVSTTNAAWTVAVNLPLPNDGDVRGGSINVYAKRTDGTDFYNSVWEILAWNDAGSIVEDETKIFELGKIQLAVRGKANGLSLDIEVKGRNNQDWDWVLDSNYTGN